MLVEEESLMQLRTMQLAKIWLDVDETRNCLQIKDTIPVVQCRRCTPAISSWLPSQVTRAKPLGLRKLVGSHWPLQSAGTADLAKDDSERCKAAASSVGSSAFTSSRRIILG